MRRSLLSTLEAFSVTQPKDLSLWQERGFRPTKGVGRDCDDSYDG